MTKKIDIKVKLLNDFAIAPRYANEFASGADLFSSENGKLDPGETRLVGTGIAFEIPDGYDIQVRSRSGLAAKSGIFVLNSPGTVDCDYRGEVKIILHNSSKTPFYYGIGDRLAQAVIAERIVGTFQTVEELSSTDRAEKGFGSTGVSSSKKWLVSIKPFSDAANDEYYTTVVETDDIVTYTAQLSRKVDLARFYIEHSELK